MHLLNYALHYAHKMNVLEEHVYEHARYAYSIIIIILWKLKGIISKYQALTILSGQINKLYTWLLES